MQEELPELHAQLAATKEGLFSEYQFVDTNKECTARSSIAEKQKQLKQLESATKQHVLTRIAVLPAIMCVCYLGLIVYFLSRGGYKAEVLIGHAARDEKFTGGVKDRWKGELPHELGAVGTLRGEEIEKYWAA